MRPFHKGSLKIGPRGTPRSMLESTFVIDDRGGKVTAPNIRARRGGGSLLVIPVLLVLLMTFGAGPAGAHGGDETDEASVLVRQAIALIVSSPDEPGEIQERVQAAVQAPDVSGVDVALVEQADAALTSGDDMAQVRALLERSIGAGPVGATTDSATDDEPATTGDDAAATEAEPAAAGEMDDASMGEAATGVDPGSTVLTESLESRPQLGVTDWLLIAGSILVGLVGVWVALRFRPVRGGERAVR